MFKDEELLTYKELAFKTKLAEQTLKNYKSKGMPCVYVGKEPRFYLSEVLEYFNKGGE